MKKILKTIFIMILFISICGNVNAAEIKNSLEVVENTSGKKYLENNQGYIYKSIVDSESSAGEVTVELKLSNTKKEQENKKIYEDTEVYIIVSEGIVNNDEKFQKYLNNIKNLADKILKFNTNTKIGIIGIKGSINDGEVSENGNRVLGENDERDRNGQASDAEIVSQLTKDSEKLENDLKNMNSSKQKFYYNFQAAIRLANKSYSDNVNKLLISLYDDVPDIAIGVHASVSYGGWSSQYQTVEEAVKAQHEDIATNTRNEILTLKDKDVSFILLRPDNTSYDEIWYSTSTGEKILDFDGSPYVQKLYGTMENPTYGKMYTFDDSTLDKIITENIYEDVKNEIQPDINNVIVTDYFPNEIIENFEFSYVGSPSIGTASESIDQESKTISWNIGELKGDQVATLKYKLKLKDMNNSKLLNKVIQTNEKVELLYKDIEEKEYTVVLSDSPKIKLIEGKAEEKSKDNKEENKNLDNTTNQSDNTTKKTMLPYTGINTKILVITMLVIAISLILYKKNKKYRDIK